MEEPNPLDDVGVDADAPKPPPDEEPNPPGAGTAAEPKPPDAGAAAAEPNPPPGLLLLLLLLLDPNPPEDAGANPAFADGLFVVDEVPNAIGAEGAGGAPPKPEEDGAGAPPPALPVLISCRNLQDVPRVHRPCWKKEHIGFSPLLNPVEGCDNDCGWPNPIEGCGCDCCCCDCWPNPAV